MPIEGAQEGLSSPPDGFTRGGQADRWRRLYKGIDPIKSSNAVAKTEDDKPEGAEPGDSESEDDETYETAIRVQISELRTKLISSGRLSQGEWAELWRLDDLLKDFLTTGKRGTSGVVGDGSTLEHKPVISSAKYAKHPIVDSAEKNDPGASEAVKNFTKGRGVSQLEKNFVHGTGEAVFEEQHVVAKLSVEPRILRDGKAIKNSTKAWVVSQIDKSSIHGTGEAVYEEQHVAATLSVEPRLLRDGNASLLDGPVLDDLKTGWPVITELAKVFKTPVKSLARQPQTTGSEALLGHKIAGAGQLTSKGLDPSRSQINYERRKPRVPGATYHKKLGSGLSILPSISEETEVKQVDKTFEDSVETDNPFISEDAKLFTEPSEMLIDQSPGDRADARNRVLSLVSKAELRKIKKTEADQNKFQPILEKLPPAIGFLPSKKDALNIGVAHKKTVVLPTSTPVDPAFARHYITDFSMANEKLEREQVRRKNRSTRHHPDNKQVVEGEVQSDWSPPSGASMVKERIDDSHMDPEQLPPMFSRQNPGYDIPTGGRSERRLPKNYGTDQFCKEDIDAFDKEELEKYGIRHAPAMSLDDLTSDNCTAAILAARGVAADIEPIPRRTDNDVHISFSLDGMSFEEACAKYSRLREAQAKNDAGKAAHDAAVAKRAAELVDEYAAAQMAAGAIAATSTAQNAGSDDFDESFDDDTGGGVSTEGYTEDGVPIAGGDDDESIDNIVGGALSHFLSVKGSSFPVAPAGDLPVAATTQDAVAGDDDESSDDDVGGGVSLRGYESVAYATPIVAMSAGDDHESSDDDVGGGVSLRGYEAIAYATPTVAMSAAAYDALLDAEPYWEDLGDEDEDDEGGVAVGKEAEDGGDEDLENPIRPTKAN